MSGSVALVHALLPETLLSASCQLWRGLLSDCRETHSKLKSIHDTSGQSSTGRAIASCDLQLSVEVMGVSVNTCLNNSGKHWGHETPS